MSTSDIILLFFGVIGILLIWAFGLFVGYIAADRKIPEEYRKLRKLQRDIDELNKVAEELWEKRQ